LIGWLVLIGAEVFSGASLQSGLWHPWTLVVTYWLYFAHFFLFTTLALWTGRTSFWSLYLWGVLFGLYESWVTKVIWHGYGGDGKFVIGSLGPYGFSEISMVVIFHPMMSFVLPLAVTCIAFPSLKTLFPDLQWFLGSSRWARVTRVYMMFNFGLIVAMNSGGPMNLALNLAFAAVVLAILLRLSRPALALADARSVVVFGRGGFVGLCLYLTVLYGLTYLHLRPEGLPSVAVQLCTLIVYGVVIAGLRLHRRRPRLSEAPPSDRSAEIKVVMTLAGVVLGLGFVLSGFRETPALYMPVVVGFLIWTPLGTLLVLIAILRGIREWRQPRTD
jgi:hypothetical protein